MRRVSFLLAAGIALVLAPTLAAADRAPWDAARVGELAQRLAEQTQRLADGLQASSEQAEAGTADPDREVGVGVRTVVIQDLAVLGRQVKSYVGAVESGLGREETRSHFGRIESLVSLTGDDIRSLPDFASYRAGLEALEETMEELGRFNAEKDIVIQDPRERAE